jgi:hypothetical protein
MRPLHRNALPIGRHCVLRPAAAAARAGAGTPKRDRRDGEATEAAKPETTAVVVQRRPGGIDATDFRKPDYGGNDRSGTESQEMTDDTTPEMDRSERERIEATAGAIGRLRQGLFDYLVATGLDQDTAYRLAAESNLVDDCMSLARTYRRSA